MSSASTPRHCHESLPMPILLTSAAFARRRDLRRPHGLCDPARRHVHGGRDGRSGEEAKCLPADGNGRSVAWVRRGPRDRSERCTVLGRMPGGYAVTFVTLLGGRAARLGRVRQQGVRVRRHCTPRLGGVGLCRYPGGFLRRVRHVVACVFICGAAEIAPRLARSCRRLRGRRRRSRGSCCGA